MRLLAGQPWTSASQLVQQWQLCDGRRCAEYDGQHACWVGPAPLKLKPRRPLLTPPRWNLQAASQSRVSNIPQERHRGQGCPAPAAPTCGPPPPPPPTAKSGLSCP